MADPPAVETVELTKRYGDFTALDSLSIRLERGRILGFIGPNGAGKTTTIKILVGLARPTSGSATVAGIDCTKEHQRLKEVVGFMPDTFGAYPNLRVHEYLDFFAAAHRVPRRERATRIAECMELAGCTYMRDLFVEALSHGMKQRVAIARTVLHDPDVLILDEPANGLDPDARIEMRQTLLRLAAMGKTLIVTSHVLPELARICDTVAILAKGKLRAFGPLDRIMDAIRQRRKMEVVLADAGDVAATAELLRGELDAGATVEPSEAEAEVRFTTTRSDPELAVLLGRLSAAGRAVCQFREVPLDLEDAFLEVTRAVRDEGGGSPQRRGGEEKKDDVVGTTDEHR